MSLLAIANMHDQMILVRKRIRIFNSFDQAKRDGSQQAEMIVKIRLFPPTFVQLI
jgi:hypothetical protein